ncbi:GMC oxidoreductase [Diaporthe helianthi]|uniref:GMC oxidoreductase n=1 Tax=Diaporthe helianthi TaxID=158607 RepID=A0A2P5HNJ5_DIAHE|nr:GMC oxidoreductase [Diaporthe helianthi]
MLTTMLIEAGPAAPEELKINVPGMVGSTGGGPYDWNFTTTPQPELSSRQVNLTRGKVLGGSSALNYLVWNRASAPEYDVWETLGNHGWNWDSMVSGMAKSENFTAINSQDYHGSVGRSTRGPIHNVVGRYRTEQVLAWVPTLESLGLSHNLQSLGGNPIGAMLQPSSINPDNNTRSYSASSYGPQARSNLAILLSTRVAKINLETTYKGVKSGRSSEDSVVATGVTLQDGSVITARREVILSAGSLQSPGILELSGIGQKDVLAAAGIKQIVDLYGVGENLQDHVGVGVTYRLKPGYNSLDILKYNATYAAEQLALWKKGEFSRYDTTISSVGFLNWRQLLGNDTALVDLAKKGFGNSTNAIDQAKLSFLSDYNVPQVEVIMSENTVGPLYPPLDDPLYGSDFVTILGIASR